MPRNIDLAWKRLKESILETKPQDLVKFVVLAVCLVLVYVQLDECLKKLEDPPVTTHSRLQLNESMSYPALTICREPPYNKALYEKFNFSSFIHIGSYPISSVWKSFPYDSYNISDFWEQTVYNQNVFVSYSLNVLPSNVKMSSSVHYTTGMCHTITPNVTVSGVGKKFGYSIYLLHDCILYNPITDNEPGWNIYIHEPHEKFSENTNFLASRQDHIFLPAGEEVEVSLDAYQFNILKNCNREAGYSRSECQENCWIKEDFEPVVNCSGPWLPKLNKPYCTNYDGMWDLTKTTIFMKPNHCCQKACRTTQYKSYIIKRSDRKSKMSSVAFIYFPSKTVIMMEEKLSYDWNDFIADLGGSVGFLLGLSVISIIGALEFIVKLLFDQKEEKKSSVNSLNEKPWKLDFFDSVSRSSTLVAEFDRY